MTAHEKYLKSVYYNPDHPAAFAGVDKIHRALKAEGKGISKGRIIKWLRGQNIKKNIYSAQKSLKRSFKRLRVISPRKWSQFDGDTVSRNRYVKSNKGYNYILVLIDVTSKFAWTQPQIVKGERNSERVQTFIEESARKYSNRRWKRIQ